MALIQVKRGIAAAWSLIDPILSSGEFGWETDTHRLKVGNGNDHWSDLPYIPVTASDLGLGNVDNTADLDKPISDATQAALDDKSDVGHGHTTSDILDLDSTLSSIDSDLTSINTSLDGKEPIINSGSTGQYWRGDKTWQTLDKSAVGLGDVDNTSDANKPISDAAQTALDGKEPTINSGSTGEYYRGDKTWATLDKDAVGLENVDNTSDANKPVSTATQTALDSLTTAVNGKEPTVTAGTSGQYYRGDKTWQTLDVAAVSGAESTANKGQAGGYASLDSGGKVPVAQLPNSIMEYQGTWNASTNSPTLADGSGSPGDVYRVSVAGSRNLGSGSISFAVGDYVIYSPATSAWEKADTTDSVATVNGYTGNIVLTASDVGLGNVDNTADSNKSVLSASKLTTARDINGVAFDGTASITIADSTKEPVITTGSTGQYYRGDKSWATLDTTAVAEGTNLYFTNARADGRISNAVGSTVQGYSSTLTSWASKTVPTGTVVGTTDSQTLENKTIKGYTETVSALGTVTTSATVDLSAGTVVTVTLTASTGCTFTFPAVGTSTGKSFTLLVKQPASTGNGTVSWPTSVRWGTVTPTLTSTAGKMDIFTFFCDGSFWYGSASQGYTPS